MIPLQACTPTCPWPWAGSAATRGTPPIVRDLKGRGRRGSRSWTTGPGGRYEDIASTDTVKLGYVLFWYFQSLFGPHGCCLIFNLFVRIGSVFQGRHYLTYIRVSLYLFTILCHDARYLFNYRTLFIITS